MCSYAPHSVTPDVDVTAPWTLSLKATQTVNFHLLRRFSDRGQWGAVITRTGVSQTWVEPALTPTTSLMTILLKLLHRSYFCKMEIISSTSLSLLSSDYDYDVYDETQYMKGLARSRHIFFNVLFPSSCALFLICKLLLGKNTSHGLFLHYFTNEKSKA